MKNNVSKDMIAPCGMNCSICSSVLDKKSKPCAGCRNGIKNKPEGCIRCIIINCEHLKTTESGFCYDCKKYPCKRLQTLDARYIKNYGMSMTENLQLIKENGLDNFVSKENIRWQCPNCGELICVHRKFCLACKAELSNQ